MRAGASIAIVAYGGDPTTIESKDLTQWLASIPNNPASINTTFTPTYELIKDSAKAKLVQAYEKSIYRRTISQTQQR